VRCGNSQLNFNNEEEMMDFGIEDFYCTKDKTYELFGSTFTEKFQYLEVKLFKCANNTSNQVCKS
jgi:hypothetical protein